MLLPWFNQDRQLKLDHHFKVMIWSDDVDGGASHPERPPAPDP
jgi:hypothetical protein